jgi:hypothetical protein
MRLPSRCQPWSVTLVLFSQLMPTACSDKIKCPRDEFEVRVHCTLLFLSKLRRADAELTSLSSLAQMAKHVSLVALFDASAFPRISGNYRGATEGVHFFHVWRRWMLGNLRRIRRWKASVDLLSSQLSIPFHCKTVMNVVSRIYNELLFGEIIIPSSTTSLNIADGEHIVRLTAVWQS